MLGDVEQNDGRPEDWHKPPQTSVRCRFLWNVHLIVGPNPVQQNGRGRGTEREATLTVTITLKAENAGEGDVL